VTTMSRTSVGFYVYRGRRYENNDIFPQMRPDRHRPFAAVSHLRQRVGPSDRMHRPIAGWLQVANVSGLALHVQCLSQRQYRPH